MCTCTHALVLVHAVAGNHAIAGVSSAVGPTITGIYDLNPLHAVANVSAVAGVSAFAGVYGVVGPIQYCWRPCIIMLPHDVLAVACCSLACCPCRKSLPVPVCLPGSPIPVP